MNSKITAPLRKPSFARDDLENSSLVHVLSQRLTNMEQQLFLLKDDLKNALGTLKVKDREIQTLRNRIALAERRRELEEAGQPVDESLQDAPRHIASNSKQEMLENEVVTLATKLAEMEKFFGDYGLAWVKEDALDEKDPKNLWVRRSNIHYTPDFEKVFLVVEELNLRNAEPQIVRNGNIAQFKMAQLLNLTLYADGMQVENNPFRKYDSPSVQEFFRDLEDGYFPTELKGSHPEGVIFKVKDRRSTKFADDAERRPVFQPGNKTGGKRALSPSSSTPSSSPGTSKAQANENSKGWGGTSTGAKASQRRSMLKKTSRPSKAGAVKTVDVPEGKDESKSSPVPPAPANPLTEGVQTPSTPVSAVEGADGSNRTAPSGEVKKPELPHPSGGAAITGEIRESQIPSGQVPGVAMSKDVVPVAEPGLSNIDKTDTKQNFKEIYRGKTPSSSALLLPGVETSTPARPQDKFGLPVPPFPSRSNTTTDVRHLGPPSKQFNNFPFPKTSEAQTSLSLLPGVGPAGQTPSQPCPQPTTHVTNITYNEAPITIQMTPSELMGVKVHGATDVHPPVTQNPSCSTHHPLMCNCLRSPRDPSEHPDEPTDGVELVQITAETEYSEKYTESALNNQNVLEYKKRSREAKNSRSSSPIPVSRQPAVTVLVGPVPPDPVPHHGIDPNVKWPHFTYLGHTKGQETIPSLPQITKNSRPKKKPTPQVVQLNKKTSGTMISVRMKTKSGSIEYNAYVYPEEPVKKLWSLLKMDNEEYSISSSKTPHMPLKRGSIGEIFNGEDLTLIISRNDSEIKTRGSVISGSGSEKSSDGKSSPKTPKDIVGGSKEVSQVANVSIPQSVDSHSSYRGLFDSLRPSSNTAAQQLRTLSQKSSSGDRRMSSMSAKAEKSVRDSRKDSTENQPPGHSSVKLSSSQPEVEKMEPLPDRNAMAATEIYNYRSSFSTEVTPSDKAKRLSKHLSAASINHRSSASRIQKSSFRSTQKLDDIMEGDDKQLGLPRALSKEPGLPSARQSSRSKVTHPGISSSSVKMPVNKGEVADTVAPYDSPPHLFKAQESGGNGTNETILKHAQEKTPPVSGESLVSTADTAIGSVDRSDIHADGAKYNAKSSYSSEYATPKNKRPDRNRDDWHPDDQPPSIRVSDIDIASNEPSKVVELKMPHIKSEQPFERRQHSNVASLLEDH